LEELSLTNCNQIIILCAGNTVETGKLSPLTINYERGISLKTDLNFTVNKEFVKKLCV